MNENWNSYKLAAWVLALGSEEIDMLKSIVRDVISVKKHATIVNIGSAAGCSVMAMVEDNPDKVFVFTIDTDPNAGVKNELVKAGLWNFSSVVRIIDESFIVGEKFPVEADIVFVDGGHDYRTVSLDIMAWTFKVKKGGYLIFHDYHSDMFPDVKRAVNDFVILPVYIERCGTMRIYRRE